MQRKDTTFCVLPDLHVPLHDPVDLDVAEQIVAHTKPDILIILGDFLDCTPVSAWLKSKKRATESLRLIDDFRTANIILDRLTKMCKNIVYIEGNHEDWIQQYIDEHPELEGLIEIDAGLKFAQRRSGGVHITHLRYGEIYKLGKLHFTHGSYTGQHHAKKHVDAFGRNIVYGHLHDVQLHVRVSPVDVNDKHMALSLGCLCDKNPTYMRNRPNNWVHAVGVGVVRADGSFNINPVIITNGVASVGGKTFTSNHNVAPKLRARKRR